VHKILWQLAIRKQRIVFNFVVWANIYYKCAVIVIRSSSYTVVIRLCNSGVVLYSEAFDLKSAPDLVIVSNSSVTFQLFGKAFCSAMTNVYTLCVLSSFNCVHSLHTNAAPPSTSHPRLIDIHAQSTMQLRLYVELYELFLSSLIYSVKWLKSTLWWFTVE